ncbi:hypothetical protein B7L68_07840 [Thermoproteus sp. CP80]|nr:hypothetical protein B7L68_07840 [Thermoproteus sp. CP80]
MDDFWEMMWATPTYAVQYIDPDNLYGRKKRIDPYIRSYCPPLELDLHRKPTSRRIVLLSSQSRSPPTRAGRTRWLRPHLPPAYPQTPSPRAWRRRK